MAAAFSVVVNIGGRIASSLGSAVARARRQVGGIGETLARAQAANARRRDQYRAQLVDAAALGASLYGLIRPAVAFESAMADVRKVVDFDTPEQFGRMGRDIVAMSRRIPMTAEGLAAIVAAAGQSGIARDELLSFAESAAQMGIAFDISADLAGETMAKWRTAMRLTQPEVVALADAVNQLSNTQASTAADISDVLRRVGGLATNAGLSAVQTAALGSSMLAAGATSEVTATAVKNLVNALGRGATATRTQREAFRALGIDGRRMARMMQRDAPRAILTVLEALNRLPAHRRNAIAGQLFGQESIAAISPLLTNLDALRASFRTVADAANYAGSMEREYRVRSETTANSLQLAANQAKALGIQIGTLLLPTLNDALGVLGRLMEPVARLAERFPHATKAIVGATAALVGLRIAAIAAGYGFTFLAGGAIRAARVVVGAARMMGAATLLAFAPFRSAGGLAMRAARQVGLAFVLMRGGALGLGGALSGGFAMMGRAMLGLLNPMAIVRGAMVALRVAFIGTGIGALVAGLAMAGAWVHNNWSNVAAAFEGFRDGFLRALGPARPMVAALGRGIGRLWRWLKRLVAPIEGAEGGFRAFGERAGEAVGATVAWLQDKLLPVLRVMGDGIRRIVGLIGGWERAGAVLAGLLAVRWAAGLARFAMRVAGVTRAFEAMRRAAVLARGAAAAATAASAAASAAAGAAGAAAGRAAAGAAAGGAGAGAAGWLARLGAVARVAGRFGGFAAVGAAVADLPKVFGPLLNRDPVEQERQRHNWRDRATMENVPAEGGAAWAESWGALGRRLAGLLRRGDDAARGRDSREGGRDRGRTPEQMERQRHNWRDRGRIYEPTDEGEPSEPSARREPAWMEGWGALSQELIELMREDNARRRRGAREWEREREREPNREANTTVNAPVNVTVHGIADADEIARRVREEVERIIEQAAARQRAALHD